MEKLILIMALLGSAYFALRGAGHLGRQVWALVVPQRRPKPPAIRRPLSSVMAIRKDRENEWSKDEWAKYDTPTYLRRGHPLPVFKTAPVKANTARKRRGKADAASESGSIPAETAPLEPATFEVVA